MAPVETSHMAGSGETDMYTLRDELAGLTVSALQHRAVGTHGLALTAA